MMTNNPNSSPTNSNPLVYINQNAVPRIRNSSKRRTAPGIGTSAPPERLGSFGTAKVP